MKKLIFCSLTMFCSLSALAQGQVIFGNRVTAVLITHVYAPLDSDWAFHQIGKGSADTPTGITDWSAFAPIGANGLSGRYGAASTFAQLLGAPGFDQPETSLQPAFPVTTFRTGTLAGSLEAVTATFSNIQWDAPASIQIVVWDNSSGLYPTWIEAYPAWASGLVAAGKFGIMNVQLRTPTIPAPLLIDLESFNLYFVVPEPSSLGLALLAATLLVKGWRTTKHA